MKKWRPPQHEDQVDFDNGIYVFAERPDEFGPRAFMTLSLVWEEREMTFLTDAATHWGMAPWALSIAREGMKITPLGSWAQVVGKHAKSFALLSAACRQDGEKASDHGGLLLLRSALRLESLAKGKEVGLDVARHCLKKEIELDISIRDAKALKYARANPDWISPATAAAAQGS